MSGYVADASLIKLSKDKERKSISPFKLTKHYTELIASLMKNITFLPTNIEIGTSDSGLEIKRLGSSENNDDNVIMNDFTSVEKSEDNF